MLREFKKSPCISDPLVTPHQLVKGIEHYVPLEFYPEHSTKKPKHLLVKLTHFPSHLASSEVNGFQPISLEH